VKKPNPRTHLKRWSGKRAFCGVRTHMDAKRLTDDRKRVSCVTCLRG